MSDETIRQWYLKFGQTSANELRHRRPRCGDKRYMDEFFLTIRGKRQHLWRDVNQDGNVPDTLVQSHRKRKAAKRFFRKVLKKLHGVPQVIITEELWSHKTRYLARRGAEAAQGLSHRAENSHQPTQLRVEEMRRFKSAKSFL